MNPIYSTCSILMGGPALVLSTTCLHIIFRIVFCLAMRKIYLLRVAIYSMLFDFDFDFDYLLSIIRPVCCGLSSRSHDASLT